MTVYVVVRYGYSYGADAVILDVEGVFTDPAAAQRWANDPPCFSGAANGVRLKRAA